MEQRSDWIWRVRAGVFGLLLLWLNLGPIWVQLLGGRSSALARPWRMYSGVGQEVCLVQYQTPDGTLLNRRELLGFYGNIIRNKQLLLRTVLATREEALRICKMPKNKGVDLRVTAHCSVRNRFHLALDPSEVLCP